MKKTLLFMSAVAMFAASSCNKVEINEPQIETPSVNVSGDATQFVAYTESATKTALNGLETVWEADDVIDINEVQYITTEGGARAIFTIDQNSYEPDDIPEAPVAPYTAGYPSNLVYDNYNAGTLSFNFSNEHILTAGEICYDVLAIAYSESDMSLHFKNVVSLIKFRVPEFAEDIKEIRISANEPLAGRIAVNYNDGKPTWAIDDESFNELVLKPSSGNFVAGDDYYAPVLPGQKTNLTFKINDKVVATGISMELKRNVIHYIATLPAAPKWAIAGTFNNWNASATPMAKDGDFFVAKGITGLNYTAKSDGEGSDTGFKFVVNGGDWKGSVGEMAAGAWEYVWDKDNGSNIYVTGAEASTAYDIYVNPSAGDNGKFVIVPAGTAMPEDIPVHEWAVAGTFNGWSTTANPMVKEGDYYVARNVTGLNFTAQTDPNDQSSSTGFKFVQNGDILKGTGEYGGVMTVGSWSWVWGDNGSNICVNGASAETAYDIYLNPSQGEHGKFVIVAAGDPMPEDKPAEEPEVTVDYWTVAGSFNGWKSTENQMTLVDDWYVVENIKMVANDQFKFCADGGWDVNRGAEGAADGVVIENNVETAVVQGGKNFAVSEGGFYSLYLNKAANKAKVVKTAELPAESIPGQPCDWAIWAQSPDWRQIDMVTTSVPDLFVAMNVELDAYKSFLVKPAADWATKFGADKVNYIKADKWFAAVQGAGDITVEAAGTYDIYFDYTTKKVYLMSAGASYTSAAEQTASGKEPVVEEPEVTANILYLALDGVWKNNDERYAAYFFNSTGNVWVSMTDSNGDGIYEVNIPAGYTYGDNVIFCRMKGTSTSNGWGNKWNQTADLTIPTDGRNLYTVKSWDNSPNTHWSTK